MTDILIITNYFPPETGAAANRIWQLAYGLSENNYAVKVLTPLPNYPQGKIAKAFRGKFKHLSLDQNITCVRLWVYANQSTNKLKRLFGMASYSLSLIWYFIRNPIPALIVINSPPLIVAFISVLFLRRKQRKIILNISDLWPKTGLELGFLKKNLSYTFLESMERFMYKNANLIVGQSEEILSHIRMTNPLTPSFLYRNYPNFKSPKIDFSPKTSKKLKLVYAGLLGSAQGIVELCNHLDYTKIEFHIYGDGNEKNKLKAFIAQHPKCRIYYHGGLSRAQLHQTLQQFDLSIIPLRKRIYGAVPSKIFEYAKLGLPCIYMGGGEAEELVASFKLGWTVEPGNFEQLNKILSKISPSELNLQYRQYIQETAEHHFNFERQLQALIKLL